MDGSSVTPASTNQPRASKGRLKYWLIMALISIGTTLIMLIILACIFATSMHWRSVRAEELQTKVNALNETRRNLAKSLDTLNKGLKYEACLSSHVDEIGEGFVTGIMKQEGGAGYVVSSWIGESLESYVHFLSPTLGSRKSCRVQQGPKDYTLWVSHKIFRAAAHEVVFYVYPYLYFVKSDCQFKRILLGGNLLFGVVGTGVEGEYLLAHDNSKGLIYVSLVRSNGESVWTMISKQVHAYLYISNSQFIRLHDGRFVLSYYYLEDKKQNVNLSARAGGELIKTASIANSSAKTVGYSCFVSIKLPANHNDMKKAFTIAAETPSVYNTFAILESAKNTILGVAITGNIVQVIELDEKLDTVKFRKKYYSGAEGFFREYGAAYRISPNKYAFSLMLEKKDNTVYVDTFIYDYDKNEITKSVSLNDEKCYSAPTFTTDLSHRYDGSAVLAVSTMNAYALISVNSNVTDIAEGDNKGFWHMAETGNGGYVVNRDGRAGVWTFYPWQDDNSKLNCTEFM